MIRSLAVVGAAVLLCSSVQTPADASVVSVPDVAALQTAINKARPGQRIVLANGVHRADKPIKITKSRITIAARRAGRTVLSSGGFEFGAVRGVTVEGFVFSGTSSLSVPAE